MVIAVFYNKKNVFWFEFLFGFLISIGMVLFAVTDFKVYPKFNFLGENDNLLYFYIFFNIHP
jgi:hypothetical protein